MAKQTLLLGREAARVQAAMDRLQRDRVIARIWEGDASVWSADPDVQADIRHRLGWLRIADVMAPQLEAIAAFGREVQRSGRTHAMVLGMGGSGLFPEVCREILQPAGGLDLLVLETTDLAATRAGQSRAPLSRLLVIVSSKSGTASEVPALSEYFYGAFESAGIPPGQGCVGITDEGTPLAAEAERLKFLKTFVHGPKTGADVGGRFSALTYFGLVPGALMGVDLPRLVQRARTMFAACGPAASDNPAVQLGAVLGGLAAAGCDKLTILASPALESFGTWAEQAVSESTGKMGRGITPIMGEPLRPPASYSADRVFLELQLASQMDRAVEQQARALADAGRPVVRIIWDDPYDLGGEVAKWSLATAIVGHLMEMNPFDEPNVQSAKDRTKALLKEYVSRGSLKEEPALFADPRVAVYGSDSAKPESLAQCLGEFLQRARPSEYVALLSFLPRTPTLDLALKALRARIAERTGRVTILGVGPRYLHSTGQLYKGGPDAGVFLLLTADSTDDLPIPGERFTFSVLKNAQAVGDFQAMQEKGRRILRLHFRGNLDDAFQRCFAAIDELAAPAPRR